MVPIRQSLVIAAILGMTMASPALAQDDARARLLIPELSLTSEVGRFPRGAPGTSTGSPIAYGANWGDVYGGAGFQTPARYSGLSDGSVTVGMGFANAGDIVGLDVGLTALSTARDGFGRRMGLSAKLHKLLPDNWGIAAGVTNIYLNGQTNEVGLKPSLYGVVSKVWDLQDTWLSGFKGLTLSAGAGNQDFRLEQDIRNNTKTIGAFGSAALRVWDQLALIVDWPGQDLDVGLSIVPIKNFPLILTPAIVDLTGSAGTHNYGTSSVRARFSLGAGMAVRF
jgi:hypothetical protein